MSRQSTRACQSTRSCLACETGEIVCFLHQKCYPSNIFHWGAPRPPPPPDTHLQSTFIRSWLCPWAAIRVRHRYDQLIKKFVEKVESHFTSCKSTVCEASTMAFHKYLSIFRFSDFLIQIVTERSEKERRSAANFIGKTRLYLYSYSFCQHMRCGTEGQRVRLWLTHTFIFVICQSPNLSDVTKTRK